jgi:hypothetical protein
MLHVQHILLTVQSILITRQAVIGACSRNHCCSRKAISIIMIACAALVIQHAKCMHPVILSPVACPAVLVFPQCLINGTISGGGGGSY